MRRGDPTGTMRDFGSTESDHYSIFGLHQPFLRVLRNYFTNKSITAQCSCGSHSHHHRTANLPHDSGEIARGRGSPEIRNRCQHRHAHRTGESVDHRAALTLLFSDARSQYRRNTFWDQFPTDERSYSMVHEEGCHDMFPERCAILSPGPPSAYA